jgi:hypothetical protein
VANKFTLLVQEQSSEGTSTEGSGGVGMDEHRNVGEPRVSQPGMQEPVGSASGGLGEWRHDLREVPALSQTFNRTHNITYHCGDLAGIEAFGLILLGALLRDLIRYYCGMNS